MRGKMLFLAILCASGGVALMLLSAPVSAQSPTVTPYPAIIATATAAAARLHSAQAQRQQADALAVQAQQARTAADASFAAAQQAADEARAALQAQQIGAAGEALGRAEASIQAGRDTGAQLNGIVAAQQGIIVNQAVTLTQLLSENQQLRNDNQQLKVDKQTILQNYNAASAKLQAQSQSDGINSIALMLVVVIFLLGLLGFAIILISNRPLVIKRRDPPAIITPAPPDEVIDNEADNEYETN